ncbi:MAG: hypothetical protein WCY81_03975 [Sphaerochaetaceae bacterium]
MNKRRRLFTTLVIVILMVLLFLSCSQQRFWYGYSDRYAFAIFPTHKEKTSVVIMPIDLVLNYKESLEQRGVESDNLGALQDLFGLQGSHYIRGTRSDWDSLASYLVEQEGLPSTSIRPSVEAMISLSVKHLRLLSKSELAFILESLLGPRTTTKDVKKLLQLIKKSSYEVIDMGYFVHGPSISGTHTQWIQQWVKQFAH